MKIIYVHDKEPTYQVCDIESVLKKEVIKRLCYLSLGATIACSDVQHFHNLLPDILCEPVPINLQATNKIR